MSILLTQPTLQSQIDLEIFERDVPVINHISLVYEENCRPEIWQLVKTGFLDFKRLGGWWDRNTEIDIIGINGNSGSIAFGECKFNSEQMDVDVLNVLLEKKTLCAFVSGC